MEGGEGRREGREGRREGREGRREGREDEGMKSYLFTPQYPN